MSEDSNQDKKEKTTSTADEVFSFFSRVINYLRELRHRMQNLEKSNMELGVKHMKDGNYLDAALRFKFVCWKNENNSIAQYMQGKAYTYAGQSEKAIQPLKIALERNPDLEEARFLLSACGEKIPVERVPPSLLVEHLDGLVDDYEKTIKNQIIETTNTELKKYFGDRQGFNSLHLDCRVGTATDTMIAISDHIVGVDPSLKMISRARDKRVNDRLVYNELINKTANDYLDNCDKKFDIIFATVSFINYLKLDDLLEKISNSLNKDGIFIFSITPDLKEKHSFDTKQMIFVHSEKYIDELSEKFGLEIISKNEIQDNRMPNDILYSVKKK